MIQTTFNAQTVFLINDAWDGNSALQADFKLPRDTVDSLTGRESRRPYGATLRTAMQYTVSVQSADLRTLQGSLRNLNTQPVIVPLWPAMTTWANRAAAPISGGLRIAWKDDWSQFTIYAATDVEPSWPSAGDNFAPALMGFIKPTQPSLITPSAAQWKIDFTESSPAAYALAPAAGALALGPKPTGYATAPYLFPYLPDFSRVSEGIAIPVAREQIGFSREQRTEFYTQAASRNQTANYTLVSQDLGTFLSFFQAIAAPGSSFWASGYFQVAELTQDVAAVDTVLHVSDTTALLVGDYISLYSYGTTVARKISAKTANTITVDSAAGVALPASLTCIFPLCLASLPGASASIKWISPDVAGLQLQWTQLPTEELLPGDETLGQTIGKQPLRITLFQFIRDYGNGTIDNWYFSGYEAAITYSGNTYLYSGRFSVSDIPQSLNLATDEVTITSDIVTGNPLNAEVALTSEAPLSVKITIADYDGVTVSNAQQVFFGEVTSPSKNGGRISAKCKIGNGLTRAALPRMICGTMCNHLAGTNDGTNLISFGCTGPDSIMPKANWKFTALVAAPLSAAFPPTVHVSSLTGVGTNGAAALAAGRVFANWFANGWIEWGAGSSIQRRAIVGSTVPVGGALALTLHRYFNGVPNIGDTVTFYPGCDGLFATCKAYDAANNPTGKFANDKNFGGEPFLPITNPSTTGLNQLGTQGGKK
jgi:hypothetical protein